MSILLSARPSATVSLAFDVTCPACTGPYHSYNLPIQTCQQQKATADWKEKRGEEKGEEEKEEGTEREREKEEGTEREGEEGRGVEGKREG